MRWGTLDHWIRQALVATAEPPRQEKDESMPITLRRLQAAGLAFAAFTLSTASAVRSEITSDSSTPSLAPLPR